MKTVIVVAGGTGGHINAALAIGEKLSELKFKVIYFTGMRPLDYKLFKNSEVNHLNLWPLREKNPFKIIRSLIKNVLGFISLILKMYSLKPYFIIGTGGYVCGPTLLAGRIIGSPIYIVEQNATMGLTNKLLTPFVNYVFTHFYKTKGFPSAFIKKSKIVGNPIRSSIGWTPHRVDIGSLKILVFGGSLGAAQINHAVYDFMNRKPKIKISIIHQTGENISQPLASSEMIEYKSFTYLDNIQDYYAWADVIVARAGASTISEVRVVGKPVLLVPFPKATDNHQWFNAKELQREVYFTVKVLTETASTSEIVAEIEKMVDDYKNFKLEYLKKPTAAPNVAELIIQEILADASH